MLSLANVGNGQSAASYYETRDDYYTDDRSPSAWHGQAAASLGLAGPVDSAVFANLLDGRLPTGETLHHAAAGRRGGTDATFSAPKSVSLQALVGGDSRLFGAHQRAVDRALAYAEGLAACRVTEDGKTRYERTGNLLIARFDHDLSRACDPQLHTHCVLINATRRPDGEWRALDNEQLYRHKMLLGALYRAELAREAQALGYAIRVTHADGRFELAHIDEHQVRAFSQRSAAVEAYLQNQGKARDEASAWLKKLAAVVTRDKKTAVDRAMLRQDWLALSQEHGIDYAPPVGPAHVPEGLAAQRIVTDAVAHVGERQAVFSRVDLLRTALERGVGVATADELETALDEAVQSGGLVACGERFTTVAEQEREAKILSIELAGREALAPIHAGDKAPLRERMDGLSEEQQRAALAVLCTHHQIIGIQGRAGVGKTTLLSAVASLVNSSGYTAKGLAPSASASRELASTGMPAETIAAFMQRERSGLNDKTLLVVDEAGMTSTGQMLAILKAAKAARCRVVLVGDTAQLASVESGKPFAQLQANGMATTLVGQIQRQKNPLLKRAVELAVDGQVALAVELLEKDITQIVAAPERFERIADDYLALPAEERAKTRVIAGTRHARAEINRRIRERLTLGEGSTFTLLTRKDLTEAERKSTLSYQAGDVVQADVDYPSLELKRGEYAQVVARIDHRLLLQRPDGVQVPWQPTTAARLSAFVPETCELAVGDQVRVTANDRQHGLINGDLAKVVALDADRRLTLEFADSRRVTLNGERPLALDYGYCSTVYSAQGQTCERVLIEADSHSLTANQNCFYVAISRARQTAQIYTDDREMLPVAMGRELERESALDLRPYLPCAEFELAS